MTNEKKISSFIENSFADSPSQVTINGPNDARQGDVVNFQCSTAPSNPAAEIRWTIDGRQRRTNVSAQIPSNEGGWVTTSNISITVESNKRSISLLCQGINMQLADNIMSSHTLNILCKEETRVSRGNYFFRSLAMPMLNRVQRWIYNEQFPYYRSQIHHRNLPSPVIRKDPLFRLVRVRSLCVCRLVAIHRQRLYGSKMTKRCLLKN